MAGSKNLFEWVQKIETKLTSLAIFLSWITEIFPEQSILLCLLFGSTLNAQNIIFFDIAMELEYGTVELLHIGNI